MHSLVRVVIKIAEKIYMFEPWKFNQTLLGVEQSFICAILFLENKKWELFRFEFQHLIDNTHESHAWPYINRQI